MLIMKNIYLRIKLVNDSPLKEVFNLISQYAAGPAVFP